MVIVDRISRSFEKKVRGEYFYVTDAYACERSLFYDFKGVPKKPVDAITTLKFKFGDFVHRIVVDLLYNTPDVHIVAAEMTMPTIADCEIIHGRIDLLVSIKGEEKLIPIDVKSTSGYGFKLLENHTQEPDIKHISQMQFYLKALDLPKGILLYVNKDTQALLEYVVHRDDEAVMKVISRMQALMEKIKANEIPAPIDKTTSKWDDPCKFCGFKDHCLNNTKSI